MFTFFILLQGQSIFLSFRVLFYFIYLFIYFIFYLFFLSVVHRNKIH